MRFLSLEALSGVGKQSSRPGSTAGTWRLRESVAWRLASAVRGGPSGDGDGERGPQCALWTRTQQTSLTDRRRATADTGKMKDPSPLSNGL